MSNSADWLSLGIAGISTAHQFFNEADKQPNWSANSLNAIHDWEKLKKKEPEYYPEKFYPILILGSKTATSDTYARWYIHWEYNGKDIRNARIVLNQQNSWLLSSADIPFRFSQDRDEKNGVAVLRCAIDAGLFNPAGLGQIKFNAALIICGDGTCRYDGQLGTINKSGNVKVRNLNRNGDLKEGIGWKISIE